jgi:hypothetical protein
MANFVPSSPFLVTLIMEALISSEALVLTRATWHNFPEDAIFHEHSSLKGVLSMSSMNTLKEVDVKMQTLC